MRRAPRREQPLAVIDTPTLTANAAIASWARKVACTGQRVRANTFFLLGTISTRVAIRVCARRGTFGATGIKQRVHCGVRIMKISLHRSLLLAVAASLGIEAVAISAEPAAGDKIRAATPVKKEARGLLASRIAAMAEPVQEQLEQPVAQERAPDTFVPATFQNASWQDFSNETLSNESLLANSTNSLSSSCGEGNCSS